MKTQILGVRSAQPSDRAFVIGLAERFGATRPSWRQHDEVVHGTQRQLANAFDEPNAANEIFVAFDERAEPVGFIYVVTHQDFFTGEAHGHVSEVATVVDGSGAGSLLMAAAEAWSRERRFRYLSLNVNDANDAAARFYQRRAYRAEYRHLVKIL